MNLTKLEKILSESYPSEMKRYLILEVIAKDEKAVPDILSMLDDERKKRKELIKDMNLQLSQYACFVDSGKKQIGGLTAEGLIEKTKELYTKYKGIIFLLLPIKDFNRK